MYAALNAIFEMGYRGKEGNGDLQAELSLVLVGTVWGALICYAV